MWEQVSPFATPAASPHVFPFVETRGPSPACVAQWSATRCEPGLRAGTPSQGGVREAADRRFPVIVDVFLKYFLLVFFTER